ncbi:MAG: GNAT family N-acetyltransferase [Acetivibrionales bacterium]
MKTLETERLILRPFEETDFEAVHAYASVVGNVRYVFWGPHDKSQTRAFISQAIARSKENPCKDYQFAAVLKSGKKLIGACNLTIAGEDEAVIGWILHRDYCLPASCAGHSCAWDEKGIDNQRSSQHSFQAHM